MCVWPCDGTTEIASAPCAKERVFELTWYRAVRNEIRERCCIGVVLRIGVLGGLVGWIKCVELGRLLLGLCVGLLVMLLHCVRGRGGVGRGRACGS